MSALTPEWVDDARRLVDDCGFDGLTLELPPVDNLDPPQWHRLLAGAPLGWPELAAGLAVPRRLIFRGSTTPVPLAHMGRELVRGRGATYVLSAEAGEGKSTYLHQLAYGSAPELLVLRWATRRPLDLDGLDRLRRVVSTVLDPVPELVVVAEIQPGERPANLVAIADSCLDRVGGTAATVFLAARAREAGMIARRTNARLLRFASRSRYEASCLRSSLARCVDELEPERETVEARYPSLQGFISLTEDEQLDVYLQPDQPLIVSLLQATYGQDFRTRLANEITDLLPNGSDRGAAYLVYLASIANGPVSDEVLLTAFPDAEIEARGANDPWIRQSGENSARHPLIAQTAIQEGGPNAALRAAINRVFDTLPESPEMSSLLRDLVLTGARWEPIAAAGGELSDSGRMKGELIRLLRAGVQRRQAELPEAISLNSVSGEPDYLEWARALYFLIPDRPTANHRYLVEMCEEFLVLAHNVSTLDDVVAARRIRYLRDKARATLASIDAPDHGVPLDVCEDWIETWAHALDDEWPGADFFFDTFNMADRVVAQFEISYGAELDDREIARRVRAYRVLIDASFYCELHAGDAAEVKVAPRYGRRIGREASSLGWDHYRGLLQHSWEISKQLGIPSFRAAALLAAALGDHGQHADEPLLWEDVVRQLPSSAPAIYRLARCWTNPEQAQTVRDLAGQGLGSARNRLELALLHHALALAGPEGNQQEQLRAAIDLYAQALGSREWRTLTYGDDPGWAIGAMQSACAKLTDLDPEANVMHLVDAARARLQRRSG